MNDINIWSVIVAAVVSFGIGALWYSPILFGKEWMSLVNMTEADMADARAKGMWKSYLLNFISTLISFAVLAFLISFTDTKTASDGAFLGFMVWLGFVIQNGVADLLWRKAPMKLVLIDTIQILVSLVIGGAIIGGWQ